MLRREINTGWAVGVMVVACLAVVGFYVFNMRQPAISKEQPKQRFVNGHRWFPMVGGRVNPGSTTVAGSAPN